MTADKKSYRVVKIPAVEIRVFLKKMIFDLRDTVLEIEIDRPSVEWALRTSLKYLNSEDRTIVEAWLQKEWTQKVNV
jgi:hypothetical protein